MLTKPCRSKMARFAELQGKRGRVTDSIRKMRVGDCGSLIEKFSAISASPFPFLSLSSIDSDKVMNDTPAARFLRQPAESSLPFNLATLSQSLLNSSPSTSPSSTSPPSDYESSSPSLVSYSSSGSPASSLASSPSLRPKLLPALSSATDDLSPLSGSALPTTTELSLYAASIIRNEAYALLSLAARLSPASQPIVSDEELDSASNSESSSVEGLGFDEDTHPSRRESISGPSGGSILSESRTNVAFRQVVDLIRDMPAHGKVLVTGIGKSGIAGKKMVATFCSLGTFDFISNLLVSQKN